ncbi:MAG: XRE family transcriptional regulator [Brasilonema octagenarum HA4186-MV1]|jgi:transcriptional regulator with XRE-family HTH domain|nr:XRE family transcriptional regulator [Brasilonema octagenarum HA4186-MV1]
MLQSDKVQSSEEGKIRLRNAYKEAGLTIEKLAEKAKVSQDTIKRLLGTKDYLNGVERRQVESIAKVLDIKPTDIVDPKDWNPQQIPPEFERLIKDKTESFRGRKFVFDAIEEFFSNNPNGYFTVVGDAGMGKSAIAAKYVLDNPEAICFFNIRAEGMNRPELFLKKIRDQLMNRYQLQDAADADLSTLLTKAGERIGVGDRLVIVVDALDEVDQESTGNLLYLPTILPENVYFLLTRRPYNQNEKRLNVSPSVSTKELDLRDYADRSSQDVKEYIWLLLNHPEYKQGLSQWIKKQNHLSTTEFVEEVATKSENNFMYLRYVLPAIADGFYNNKPLDELPVGLQGYYENHWQLMGMTTKPLPKNKIKIIYVMCALRSAASREIIAKYSKQNELSVQEVLNGWAQFLQKQENYQPPRYRFYHESFRDFLHRQDIVQAAGVNLPDVSAEVADNMTEGLFGYE